MKQTQTLKRLKPFAFLAAIFIMTASLCGGLGQNDAFPTPEPGNPPTLDPNVPPPATQSSTEDLPDSSDESDTRPADGVTPGEPDPFTELPPRDRFDLAARFLGVTEADFPDPVSYSVGDVISFWVSGDDGVVEVEAKLVFIAEHVYMWIEEGFDYDAEALERSANFFDENTYPTTRSFFGSEPSPGIDGDPRLHILHSDDLGSGVAGYYYSPSEYPANVVQFSNEKEMFFINIANTPPGSIGYDSVIAHEFQHMIQWNVDTNEESWLNEGLSELSAFLNGFGVSGFAINYFSQPDTQLTTWPEVESTFPYYGGGYLFSSYFLDRFGQDALRILIANPDNGMAGVESTLEEIGAALTADEFFADWLIANHYQDGDILTGVYGYPSLPNLPALLINDEFSNYPLEIDETVNQYGGDFYRLYGPGTFTFTFTGEEHVQLFPTSTIDTDGDPSTDDRFVWWSNRGDNSNMTLTATFDLSEVTEAVLDYDIWYSIEELWDYGYISVSTNGGATWTPLETPYTTTENPNGTSYGQAYTGSSSSEDEANNAGWLHESLDLSAYTGGEVMVRFEIITDDAVNQPGMAIDNVCIEAIGFCDDMEDGEGIWQARGFVHHDNVLQQRYIVQLIIADAEGNLSLIRLPLDEFNRGEIEITLDGLHPSMLIISGATRFTTVSAPYEVSITPIE